VPHIATARFETPFGEFLVASGARGVFYLSIDAARAERELDDWVRRYEPDAIVRADPAALQEVTRQVLEWADGRRRAFDVELDLRGTEFQLRCWQELLRIPCGQTRTYGEMAARVGQPGAARAVGAANGANPVPVIVPCHRVVAKDGLGGFGGGLVRKRAMLELEGALQKDLFSEPAGS
jgi:methylated-DNA-[protein]-cysteine S-methyltransferase